METGGSGGNGTSGGAHIPFCGELLVSMHDVYTHYHGYASLLVCAFGSVANVLNIAVLTRREMVSPTNAILTGLAVADLLVMVEYVPFAYHMYLRPADYPRADRFSYNWSLFVLLHSDFSQAFHTISIWLTVTLAVWRSVKTRSTHPVARPFSGCPPTPPARRVRTTSQNKNTPESRFQFHSRLFPKWSPHFHNVTHKSRKVLPLTFRVIFSLL